MRNRDLTGLLVSKEVPLPLPLFLSPLPLWERVADRKPILELNIAESEGVVLRAGRQGRSKNS
jgi:hypothetical protein